MSKRIEKQEMCGLGVVIEELAHTIGYDLHIDNDVEGEETKVDFDFTGSENLALVDNGDAGITVHGPFQATVIAPIGATAMKLSLRQVDKRKNIELKLQTTPAEETMAITLECQVVLVVRSLAGLRGYDLRFNNPADEAITLEFNFSKSENLSVTACGSTEVDGFLAKMSVEAGEQEAPFVLLETVDPTLQIAMEYSLASYPTKDADPLPTREPLKCGAYLTLQPLPKAAGYEFSIDNPNATSHKLCFDFSNSTNLRLEDAGADTEFDGLNANVVIRPSIDKTFMFALHSVDKTKGVAMSYVLHSESLDDDGKPLAADADAE